ncbi:Uncharacterised protein [Legionella busanensis]|uniref:Uncharacterized protein n=1 Tax=Legionella busanensis TaxID=190655 RepID=A0A378JIE2_9GAMM|nr:hypothetical protein [Legionella busanensis]STX50438.1 Uncharacterised protein [Legionella busanensis]
MKNLELLVVEDNQRNGMRVCLKPRVPEVLTPTLINQICDLQKMLIDRYLSSPWDGYYYVIWYYHKNHGKSGRGLDFNFIWNALRQHKDNDFESYICNVFDLLFLNNVGLGLPVINCSITDRAITGISQEFFILNQINFMQADSTNSIAQVYLNDIAKNLVFPKYVYEKNLFYIFNHYDFNSMRKLISQFKSEIPDKNKLEQIRLTFNKMKDNTIKEIYNIAVNKTKLLARLASIQNKYAGLSPISSRQKIYS